MGERCEPCVSGPSSLSVPSAVPSKALSPPGHCLESGAESVPTFPLELTLCPFPFYRKSLSLSLLALLKDPPFLPSPSRTCHRNIVKFIAERKKSH